MRLLNRNLSHGLLMGICLVFAQSTLAAPTAIYFPASFTTGDRPDNVTRRAQFPPICSDPAGSTDLRLPGLDAVRRFAQIATCTAGPALGDLSEEPKYILLVDDTSNLSAYMIAQLGQQQALQSIGGRQVVKPTVVSFPSVGARQGFKVLVVGEMSYRQANSNTEWLAAINQRFASGELVAGSSEGGDDDNIFVAHHGSFLNKRLELMENVSLEKIAEYFAKQAAEGAAGSTAAGGATAGGASGSTPPSRRMTSYMTQCFNNNVPLPPVWDPVGSTSQWVRRGRLSPAAANSTPLTINTVVLNNYKFVDVWTYTSKAPAGVCIALPRMNGSGNYRTDIQAMGVICQGNTGNACFWDNIRVAGPAKDTKYTGADIRGLDTADMKDATNLDENCSDCHRGANVFLVHEGSVLDLNDTGSPAIETTLSRRYRPLGDPKFSNPTGTITALLEAASGGSRCTTCHSDGDDEFPTLSIGYCSVVMEGFLGSSMPGGEPGKFREYTGELTAIANACCSLGGVATGGKLQEFVTAAACRAP